MIKIEFKDFGEKKNWISGRLEDSSSGKKISDIISISGTVTGISAGGLPDGCIVDADINGMASSKLSGALPAISGAALTGLSAGISMADQWSITSDNNKTNGQTIDTGWERSDYYFAQIGTGMSESSGIFNLPQTGIYLLLDQFQMNTSASYAGVNMRMSSDSGSSYSTVSYGQITNTNNGYHQMSLQAVVDAQNASTYRFGLRAYNSGNVQYSGDSNALRNG